MTTTQIIIFVILGILWIISYFKVGYRLDDNRKDAFGWFAVQTLIITLLFGISILLVTLNNQNRQKLKEKDCPEYQRIENVYILKSKNNEDN